MQCISLFTYCYCCCKSQHYSSQLLVYSTVVEQKIPTTGHTIQVSQYPPIHSLLLTNMLLSSFMLTLLIHQNCHGQKKHRLHYYPITCIFLPRHNRHNGTMLHHPLIPAYDLSMSHFIAITLKCVPSSLTPCPFGNKSNQ